MTRGQCAIARFSALLEGYQLTHCFTPTFKQLDGADTSQLDGGEATGISLASFSEELLEACDAIYVDYDDRLSDMTIYEQVIDIANHLNIQVILSKEMNHAHHPAAILPLNEWDRSQQPEKDRSEKDRLEEIPVPVVMVLTEGHRTDQLATELALRKYFKDTAYKVSQIFSELAAPLFDCENIPLSMYAPGDAYGKALMFNKFAKDLVDAERPELLIIGVPGAIGKYSNQQLQGLGLLPQIICSAVKSDAAVLCLYQAECNKDILDVFYHLTDYKFDSPANVFSIANTHAQPDESHFGERLQYIDVDSQFVLAHINNEVESGEYVLYSALNSGSAQQGGIGVQMALTDHVDSIG